MGYLWSGEHYYDVQIGKPVDDEIAVERLVAGDAAVQHIGELIIADEFTIDTSKFESVPDEKPWGRKRWIIAGQYALRAIESTGRQIRPHQLIIEEQVNRMHQLRLVQSRYRLKKHYPLMADYRLALGIHPGRLLGRYDNWENPEWAKYAAKLVNALPERRRLTRSDVEAAYLNDDGPGMTYMDTRGITLGMLDECNGFIDVDAMDEDDVAYWGARVMKANGGIINKPIITVLAGRGIGPGYTTIRRRFDGDMQNFRKRAEEIRRIEQADEEKIKNELRLVYEKMCKRKILSNDDYAASEADRLRFAAQYSLAVGCLPGRSKEIYAELAQASADSLKKAFRIHDLKLSFAFIEAVASKNRTYGFIWPDDEGLGELRVSEEDIERLRIRRNEKNRGRKFRSKAD